MAKKRKADQDQDQDQDQEQELELEQTQAASSGNGESPTAKGETVVESVTMTDSRVVDFAGRKRLLKEHFEDDAGNVYVRLDFRNGETRTFQIPPQLKNKFAGHGAAQKFGDETVKLEDIEDMVEAVDQLNERIQAGEWNVKREASELAGTSVLIKALVEHTTKVGAAMTVPEIRAYLKELSHIEKMSLRNNDEIAPIVKRLESERVSKSPKVDSNALLAKLKSRASSEVVGAPAAA